jgi:hypothetical protein
MVFVKCLLIKDYRSARDAGQEKIPQKEYGFFKVWYSFWLTLVVLIESRLQHQKRSAMKGIKNKVVVFLAVTVGGMIGIIKGEEAKQKWVFRMKSKYENRRLMAERKSIARKGGVMLDDIELASFHKN